MTLMRLDHETSLAENACLSSGLGWASVSEERHASAELRRP
jgi:hypothetical protein